MSNMPPAKSSDFSLMSVPAFWPMAMGAAMLEEGRELYARNLKFVDEEIKIHNELRPKLATPNQMRLELRTMALRDYGTPTGIPTSRRRAPCRSHGDDRRLSSRPKPD